MSNYGIIGWPLEKTYSPIIQNYLFNMNNLDSKYQPFKIKNLTTESVDTLIADLNGFNITIQNTKFRYRFYY
jgi:shikimate 5-dehydrogenase